MLRKIFVRLSLALAAALILAYILVPSKIIAITPDQIEQALDKNLPYKVENLAASVNVHDATIYLGDNGQIQVRAEFDASG